MSRAASGMHAKLDLLEPRGYVSSTGVIGAVVATCARCGARMLTLNARGL